MLPTRIYLTGFMGCGKSTIGPILANVLGYDFVDLDDAIREAAGRSVQRIFEEEGEDAFRALERLALTATGVRDHVVVALGGGALTYEANLQWTLAHGTIVYLFVPLDRLVRRLQRSRTVRPLLHDAEGRRLSSKALEEKVSGLLNRRELFYRQAHLTVNTGGMHVGAAVDAVVQALRQYARQNA